MSSIINKVKDAVSSDKHSQPEGTHGHHNSRMANAADPRIDSDRDHRAAHDFRGTGETYSGTGNYTTGGGAYTSDTRPMGTTDGPATRTDGPHKSNLMNKADPRIDSDRDHSRNMGANPHGTSGTGAYSTGGGAYTSDTRPMGTTDGPATKTDGPHKSNLMNKADPRIDSDRDHSRNMGANPHGTSGTGAYNVNETTRTGGLGGNNFGTHETPRGGLNSGVPEGSVGPHGNRMANAADPRIDSDLDGSRAMGSHTGAGGLGHTTATHHGTAAHGAHGTQGTHGTTTHGLGGSAATHGTAAHTSGAHRAPGPAPNTAGPHKSDMMNKIDPRVDSDLDGSKTMGGDKTFSRS